MRTGVAARGARFLRERLSTALYGKSIFELAELGEAKAISALPKGADVNNRRADGVTPLVLAAVNGHLPAVEALLKAGADPAIPTSEGWYPYHFAKNSKHHAVARRLLEAHGGEEPHFDYAGHFLAKASEAQLDIYRALYSDAALVQKNFINVGSGNWRHPFWRNVDYSSEYYAYDQPLIDIPWDISQLKSMDLEDESIELAYCSHTIEHLTNEQNRFMFGDVHRTLKPGGVFRITCPNVEFYHHAWKVKDPYFKQHYGIAGDQDTDDMATWFVNEIATQLVQDMPGHAAKLSGMNNEIEAKLSAMPLAEACDFYCGQIDYSIQRRFPGNHIDWWTAEKISTELTSAGFRQVTLSIPGGSLSAAMRDRNFFDLVNPTSSLFVDAVK